MRACLHVRVCHVHVCACAMCVHVCVCVWGGGGGGGGYEVSECVFLLNLYFTL